MQLKNILIKQSDIQKMYTLWSKDNNYNRQLLNIIFDIEIIADMQEVIKYMEHNNIEFANINISTVDKYDKTIEFVYINNINFDLKINTFMVYDWSTIFLKPIVFLVK